MMRVALTICAIGVAVAAEQGRSTGTTSPEGPHDYFNKLIARADVFTVKGVPRAYSFRPVPGKPQTSPYWEGQLRLARDGGYVTGAADRPVHVTYSPATDRHPHAQDAAKVVISAFIPGRTTLMADIDAATEWIPIDPADEVRGQNRRSIRIGAEVMTMSRPCPRCPIAKIEPGERAATRVHVTRGAFGTVPRAHRAGAAVDSANNSLQNQVRVPINTIGDVNATYFATWDGYWTDSYLGSGLRVHKTFQFSAGGSDDLGNIWLEPRANYGGGAGCCRPSGFDRARHVASVDVRAYNRPGGTPDWKATDGNMLGPSATRNPLRPMVGQFLIYPNRWTRFFVELESRVNDYDYFTFWVADETTAPVKLIDRLPVSIPMRGSAPNSVMKWWIELNTSTNDHLRPDGRDWVAYFRNFVMLKDPRDIPTLLVKPVSGLRIAR